MATGLLITCLRITRPSLELPRYLPANDVTTAESGRWALRFRGKSNFSFLLTNGLAGEVRYVGLWGLERAGIATCWVAVCRNLPAVFKAKARFRSELAAKLSAEVEGARLVDARVSF